LATPMPAQAYHSGRATGAKPKAWADPPVPNVTDVILTPANVAHAAGLISQSTYHLARAVSPHPGVPPKNIVRRRMPASNAPRIQIQCPPRTSCTWFVDLLIALYPKPQQSHSDFSAYKCQERVLPFPRKGWPWIFKTTFAPQETLKQWQHVQNLTYKIAFFRDPVSTMASAADERWRDTCGGFNEKMIAADVMAREAFSSRYYDAVLFAENVYPSPEATMLDIGAIPGEDDSRGMVRNTASVQRAATKPVHRTRFTHQHSERKACLLMPFLCTIYGYGYDPRYGRYSWRDEPPQGFADGTGCSERGCGLRPNELAAYDVDRPLPVDGGKEDKT